MSKKYFSCLLAIIITTVSGWTLWPVAASSSSTGAVYRIVVISDLHYPYKKLEINDSKKVTKILAAKSKSLKEN
jgi:hypothetical protein